MADLKPCPFCGGEASVTLDEVHCLECPVVICGKNLTEGRVLPESRQEAIRLWNQREGEVGHNRQVADAYELGKTEGEAAAFKRIELLIKGEITLSRHLDKDGKLIFVISKSYPNENDFLGTGASLREALEKAEKNEKEDEQ